MAAERPPRAAVRAAVRAALADLAPGDRALVALSGGPDSLALLAATVRVCAEEGLVPAAVIVDHRLQPGSAEVAARAAEQAAVLGCADVVVVGVDVARGPGSGGPESAARRARYAALEREAQSRSGTGTAVVLLGHTRDDQAETVLLGLARGSGTRSLAGMASRSGIFRRPLLGLPRDVVAAAAAEDAREDPRLAPWADPHNEDIAFTRVRVRTQVLPVLEESLGPGVSEALARTATLAREDADALDDWADRAWDDLDRTTASGAGADAAPGDGVVASLSVPRLAGAELPPAVLSRVLRRFLVVAGSPADALTMEHVRSVRALLGPAARTAEVALPGGLRARREADRLVVRA